MRLAMISPYGPAKIGGISSFVASLAASLRERGVECTVLVHEGGEDERVVDLRGPKLEFVARAIWWLLAHDPEVVHAHGHWHTLLPAVLYRAIRPRTRLIFSLHTPPDEDRPFALALMRGLMRRCDVVTAVSRDILVRMGGPDSARPRRIVIPPGGKGKPADIQIARRKLGVGAEQFVVTAVGPFVWREKAAGAELLVRAFHRFVRDKGDCNLFVVGGGQWLAPLREAAFRLQLQHNTFFPGETTNPEPFVQACDVYAQVSYKEGVPLALLDAMATGKAVIASRVGGIPEVLKDGECGILVNNEEGEIAGALNTLYEDHHLRGRLGAAASRLIKKEYTWSRVAGSFLEAYRGSPET